MKKKIEFFDDEKGMGAVDQLLEGLERIIEDREKYCKGNGNDGRLMETI